MTRTLVLLGTGAVTPWVVAVGLNHLTRHLHNRRIRAAT